jgi:hypothetical protein
VVGGSCCWVRRVFGDDLVGRINKSHVDGVLMTSVRRIGGGRGGRVGGGHGPFMFYDLG